MNNLDYTSGNALSKYPFKDNAELTWTSDNGGSPTAGYFPNNIVLDARIVQKTHYADFYLELAELRYSVLNFNSPTSADYCDFVFFIQDGTEISELVVKVYYGQTSGLTQTSTTLVQLEVDMTAFVSFLKADLTAVDETVLFGEGNDFCLATTVFPAPLATITFSNQLDADTQEIFEPKSSGTIKFEEGSNIDLSGSTSLTFDLIPGGGSGLYDACANLGSVIRTINGIASDAFHNFSLTKDACYDLTPGVNSLTLGNHCKPECSEEELKNFAHYINRIKDGVVTTTDIVSELKERYDELVTKYVNVVDLSKKAKPVFINAEATASHNRVYDFNSLTAGIYSPNKLPVNPVDLVVSYNTSVYSYVANTSYITQKNAKLALPTPGFTGQTLGCNGVIYSGLVLATQKINKDTSRVNLGDPIYDVIFNMTAGANGGYAVVPLLCGSPNFGLNYSRLKDVESGITTIKITTYPFSNQDVTGAVSLNFECSPNMVFKKGSYSSGAAQDVNIPDRFGFNTSLNLKYSTICQMEYEVLGSSLNLSFNVKLETASGSAIKTIAFAV